MITEIIKKILLDYRKGLSIEKLTEILKEKNIKFSKKNIIKQSNIFKLHNGLVFLKSTLLSKKDDFLKEFDDFLHGKIVNKKIRNDIIKLYLIFIPDALFIEWLDISLEKKIIIFDLLYNMILKQENKKDKLKTYFNKLIELYSLTLIYSTLLSNVYENNFNKYLKILKKIEPFEEKLMVHLFNVLTIPDIVKTKISIWQKDFKNIEKYLLNILENNFIKSSNYSAKLYSRVLKNEFKNFDILFLLTRFNQKSFYEWLSVLIDEKTKPQHNLFEDLGF
jgi:hypothetical protein